MSPSGRELPRAVQHVEVRYLGNDSHYMDKQTFRLCSAIGGIRPGRDIRTSTGDRQLNAVSGRSNSALE